MTHNGLYSKALEFYVEMRKLEVKPDSYTFPSVINACGSLMDLERGRVVHEDVMELGFGSDLFINNALIDMYSRCNELGRAREVFDGMPRRDIVSWNSLMSGYTSNGYFKEALEIYYQLRMDGLVPDCFSFSSVLLACGGIGEVEEGQIVHGLVEKVGTCADVTVKIALLGILICGYCESSFYEESIRLFLEMVGNFEPDILTITTVLRACTYVRNLKLGRYVHEYMVSNGYECDTVASNIIINMYAKCGDLLHASEVFENMGSQDLVSWNSLLNGYIERFDSTQIVGNALVDAYAKCGKMDDSLKQFENMKVRDIVTWNSIIASCGLSENTNLGFRMLSRMRVEGVMPDIPTFLSALPLCSYLIAKRQGKEMHGCIFRLGFEGNTPIGNALIEMYSSSGNLRNSVLVFEQMKTKDLVSWTAIISAYGMYGEGWKALEAFEHMKEAGILPDHIIFVSVIYACSHSGLVQEGRACFEQMKKDYNIEPRLEHYACVVDLLSRSGLLAEAEEFIISMPLKPDASIWGVLLSACRASGDMKIAERVSEHVLQLNPNDPGYHVLASNMYAALGKWDKVREIRTSLKAKGLKKDPGCSWLEIENKVYYFGAGDRFFKQHKEVVELLDVLSSLMAKEGYAADVKFVSHDVEEDEKLGMLCGHSERLAIAFGLIHTKPGAQLLVMKNLRMEPVAVEIIGDNILATYDFLTGEVFRS
ncbi:UNVERIFIED_CONTAM: Pentatricopeptide repeat-containing protein [Sesamum calycinum]|uniref:Pentatricopeptide repeat-containing protein n=1 Tax=Sesamum calycinum TaxID=2727403 RepID=A0AAW2SY59_9LAMI